MTFGSTVPRQAIALSSRGHGRRGPVLKWCCGWLLAVGLILAANPGWLVESALLWPPPATGPLTPEGAWSVPLASWTAADRLGHWPYGLFASIAGGVIVLAVRPWWWGSGIWSAALLAAGLSGSLTPGDLIPAMAVLAVARQRRSERLVRSPFLDAGIGTAILGVVLASSLEFGLVGLFAGLSRSVRRAGVEADRPLDRRVVLLGLILLVVLAGLTWQRPGFLPALLRPVSWIWLRPPATLLPSCAAAFTTADAWRPHLCLSLFLLDLWRRKLTQPVQGPPLLLLLTASLIGLGCVRYLALCGLAAAVMVPPARAGSEGGWGKRVLFLGGLIWIVVQTSLDWPVYSQWFVQGSVPPRMVDPLRWGTRGGVLLMNLDHSADWQAPHLRHAFPLLIDDRWDLYGDFYPEYAALCRDLGEVRHESYLLTDGTWGGYRATLRHWSPALLVVDSQDLDRIRSLSLSPDWRVLGIDGRRTIFGFTEAPQNQPQFQRTVQVLFQLEWPTHAVLDPQVLAVPDAVAARRVAAVLCALRLPYAALRVIREDESPQADVLRTWCYLELAHRARRYAGAASLVDQFRAVHRLRKGLHNLLWSPSDRDRIARSLSALELDDVAQEFTAPSEPGLLRSSSFPSTNAGTTLGIAGADAEERIRGALLRGDRELAQSSLADLPPFVQRYYAALLSAADLPAADVYRELYLSATSPDFPPHLAGEAAFFLGCLAIEAGDAGSAIRWLEENRRREPRSVWSPLRQFYLLQLGRR